MTRQQEIQARGSALAHAVRARSGVLAAVAATPNEEGATTAELWLYGVVGGYWFGFNDKDVADQLRGLNVDQITVRVNSPGGDSIQGIAIGNLLRNHKASVTVVVDGLAASAASLIAIAGDEVVMSPGSQMMIHDPWFFTLGSAAELRKDAAFLDTQGANMAGIYASRAGGTADAWREAMTSDELGSGMGTWYTADEAVAAKLADRVGTVVAVSAAPEAPPVDLDDEDDEMSARAAWDLSVLIAPAARAAWSFSRTHKPPTASADGPTHTEGGSAVALSNEQITMRRNLGIAEDADEATMAAALAEALAERAEPPAEPAVPQIPEGMALVDSALLTQIQGDAAAGRTAQTTLATQERDREINAAFAAGKIAATSREKLVEAWDKDPVTTKAVLDTLTPGLIPVSTVGHDSEPSALGEGVEINDAEWTAFAGSLGLTKEDLRG